MLEYINKLPSDYRDMINEDLLHKTFDKPLTEYLFLAFKGFEILSNIKILGYEWCADEDKFDVNDHVVRRNTNKNKIIKNMAETRCGVFNLFVEVGGYDKDGKYKYQYLIKPLIVPIEDENGYFMIKGKKCYLIYQLVDKMLYPSFSACTIKSLMPICTKVSKDIFHDIDGIEYTIPTYTIQIFKDAVNVLLIYSHLGITKTLNFLEVDRFIRVESINDEYLDDEEYIRFNCNKGNDVRIAVLKDAFEKEIYIQSIVGCLINLFNECKVPYKDIDNVDEWLLIVGKKNTVSKGRYQHIFFNRLLDDVTRGELKINEYDKQNIYYLLRWIIQNFHKLWEKDNLSMINKRLRCHEYIGSFITKEISSRINRIISLGNRATLKDFLNMFKFSEDLFMTTLYSSGVLRYAENNSDMDMKSKTLYTKKGPNALGIHDSRRIPTRQRTLHPSMLGYLSIEDSSNSDPGQSGSLSPYCDLKSMYFDDSLYENEMHYKIAKLLDQYPTDYDGEEFHIKCENDIQYNEVLDKLFRFGDNKIKMYGTTNDQFEIIVAEDPRKNYRQFDEEKFLMKDENENTENK